MDEKKHPGGRPPKYNKDIHPVAVEYMARSGMIDAEMAKKLNISKETFYEWKRKHKEFSDAVIAGKEKIDELVENALLKSALGYEHEAVHISNYQGVVTETPIIKKYPPNDRSLQFWLKNRRPDRWREKQEIEHSGELGVTIVDDIKGKKDE